MVLRILKLFSLYLAGVGAAAQIAKIIPAFAYLQDNMHLSLSQATLVMSAISFAAIVFGAMAGRVVVALGLWRMLSIALALSLSAGLILPSMPSFAALVAVRIVEGMGHILIVSAVPTLMVGLVARKHVGLVLGVWASFFGVAFAGSQLFTWTGLNVTNPAAFLRWHVILFLPALVISLTRLNINAPQARVSFSLLPTGLSRNQVMIALAFLFHAGVFTSMLAFAQIRIGSDIAARVAPLLPLLSLAFVVLGSSVLTMMAAGVMFGMAAAGLITALLLALIQPLSGYLGAFAAIGVMQSAIFARIGETCQTEAETSATNGAYTQLGNLGNVVVPYMTSLAIGGAAGIPVEYLLAALVACAALMQRSSAPKVQDAV